MKKNLRRGVKKKKFNKMSENYTYEQAKEMSMEYFDGDDMAADTFLSKYAMRDEDGNVVEPTPDYMHKRLAKELSRIESKYNSAIGENEIYEELKDFNYIIPQGSIMSILGTGAIASLSNCVVLPAIPDSYGGICYADEQLVHLMKRRCVDSQSTVCTKEKGFIPINDVEVGDYILSRTENGKTKFSEVKDKCYTSNEEEAYVDITTHRGGTIRVTSEHQVLVQHIEGGKPHYINAEDVDFEDHFLIAPRHRKPVKNFMKDDLAWAVGAYIGDGNSSKIQYGYRVRLLADSFEFVDKFKNIMNSFTGSEVEIRDSNRPHYSSRVWEYSSSVYKNKEFIDKYTDGQTNNKTYNCFVPSYIREHNFASFIAGLVDADGYIKSGRAVISTVSRKLAEDIAERCRVYNIDYHIGKYNSKNSNEQIIYRVTIKDDWFLSALADQLSTPHKSKDCGNLGSYHSLYLPITEEESKEIVEAYERKKSLTGSTTNLLSKNIQNLKEEGRCGKAALFYLVSQGVVSESWVDEVQSRSWICEVSIEENDGSRELVDISVPDTNNFYTGNGDMVCVHNCGVGLDISTLRPSETPVNNSAKSSTGAVSFMERFSNTTREVAQSGRRGALMITMDVRHPDIEQFVHIKQNLDRVTGANISIRLTDEFMKAVEDDKDFTLRFPIDSDNPQISRVVKAKELWDQIVKCAHSTAEPGLIFWDRQDDYSPATVYPGFENVSTNPCSEIAMQGSDTCRLTAINMSGFVGKPFTEEAYFDWEKLRDSVRKAVSIMDDIVDLEIEQIDKIMEKVQNDPEAEEYKNIELSTWHRIRDNAIKGRRTGLGITGLGDMLAYMGMRYDEKDAIEFIDDVMKYKMESELEMQVELAKRRGAFPEWDSSKEIKDNGYPVNPFYTMVKANFPTLYEEMNKHGRRNISWSTVAPTGSLSVMAQVTSGIEPLFAPYFKRRKKVNPHDENVRIDYKDSTGDAWQEYFMVHPGLKDFIKFSLDSEEVDVEDKAHLDEMFQNSPYVNATAPDIDWISRVEVQSVVQKYTTHSISSTINLPRDVSVQKVKEIYKEAWDNNLKGITVYRDGARDGVLITDDDSSGDWSAVIERPKTVEADVYHSTSEGQQWVVVVGVMDEQPIEVFAFEKNGHPYPPHRSRVKVTKRGSGKFILHDEERDYANLVGAMESSVKGSMTTLISYLLQRRASVDEIVDAIDKSDPIITSFAKAVQIQLRRYGHMESFPECETKDQCNITREEGCVKCLTCGISKCG